MDDLNNRVQPEADLKFLKDEVLAETDGEILETEEIPSGEADELQMLWEQLSAAQTLLAEKEEQLRQIQADCEEAMEKCREEAQRVHFEDRLELELWKAGAKNPKAVRALLHLDKLSLSESGLMEGLSSQLSALKQSDSYLFLAPAVVGSKGNFVRPREGAQDQSLKDAIASYYFG